MSDNVKVADLLVANPIIESHMRVWQTERQQKGEDPLDWPAFRAFAAYINAPDPGGSPPSEFFWFDWEPLAIRPEPAAYGLSVHLEDEASSELGAADPGRTKRELAGLGAGWG